MSSQPLSHREEYLKKKRKAALIKYGLILLLCVTVFIGLVLISRIPKFRISTINLSGEILVSKDDVSNATKNFLSGNYIWLFPKNNFLLYPHNELEQMLKEKFQRINTISINIKNFQNLEIKITERNLNALWCDGVPSGGEFGDAPAPEKCYFMDKNGLIFSEAPDFSGDAYFKYYGEVSATNTPIGTKYIASADLFKDISNFITRVQDISLHPIYLINTEAGQFTLGLLGGGKIYIDTKDSLSKTADNLQALLGTISATTTFSALNFDYIDLRFGNKLFYKLK